MISMKKWLMGMSAFLIMIIVAFLCIGNYFFNYALVRKNGEIAAAEMSVYSSIYENGKKDRIDLNRKIQKEKTSSWLNSISKKEINIQSNDKLQLFASEFKLSNESNKWIILVHGYTSEQSSIYDIARHYSDKGYNVLTPDLRAHGLSEGKYVGMGWLDRNDLLLWIDYLLKNYRNSEIILHGVSMGAATVMMASGENLPTNVKLIVEDCGYTSVWDIFSFELKLRFNLSTFPVLNAASFITNVRTGYNYKEASSIDQIKKSVTTILFIHGNADEFVPVNMAYKLYDNANINKELIIVDGAGHAESRLADEELYYGSIFSFIDKYLS